MFGSFGVAEILLVVLLLTLFFGARRIPEIAKGLGTGIREFKHSLKEDDEERPDSLPGNGDTDR